MNQNLSSNDDPNESLAALGAEAQVDQTEETSAPEETQGETIAESETAEAEAESTEGEESEADENAEQQKPKKTGGFKKRIQRLNAQKAMIEQERDYWRQQALRDQTPANQQNPVPVANGRPKEEDFEKHSDYVEALTDWKVGEAIKADRQRNSEEQLKSEFARKDQAHGARVRAFAEKHDDFAEVTDNLSDVPRNPTLVSLIVDSDIGPEILYALGKEPDEARRIASLPPMEVARAIGKLEARLNTASAKSKPNTTAAPPPVKPVTSRTAGTKDPSKMDYQEYKAWRESQLKR